MRTFCMVLLLLTPILLPAQGDVQRIWEPSVTYSHKVNDFWSASAQFSAFRSPELLERIEASAMVLRRLNPRSTAGLGYLNRYTTPLEPTSTIEHRYILQFGYQQSWQKHAVSHRFRAEERVREAGNIHRLRYRLSLRTPLQGDRLDPGECYLQTQNEGLASFSQNPFSGENRLSVHLGYQLKNRQRVEIGLQHRASQLFTDRDVRHIALLSTAWHFTN